ncbi:MAG: hypothetical protein FJW29_13320 [Acidobacteria bacterium]|nr:hypothetical protein [Acidobacteriota bacterium]
MTFTDDLPANQLTQLATVCHLSGHSRDEALSCAVRAQLATQPNAGAARAFVRTSHSIYGTGALVNALRHEWE